ncbi:MAG: pyridoxamine 5'-phosphate oxidase family protein [Micromonosporaceae bacterium]|nr:pyridoxamine 5'-phosphate oxidase family protein [Micromonosporaceae bacterium]
MTPTAAQMHLPPGYAGPDRRLLDWTAVRRRLAEARRYWLATTRPDGRPHVVPLDGIWLADLWYFGGAPEAIHQRNLLSDPRVAMNLADPESAVIVEGTAEFVTLATGEAVRLAEVMNEKYPEYKATTQRFADGVWRLRPALVLAWDQLDVDATRFTF